MLLAINQGLLGHEHPAHECRIVRRKFVEKRQSRSLVRTHVRRGKRSGGGDHIQKAVTVAIRSRYPYPVGRRAKERCDRPQQVSVHPAESPHCPCWGRSHRSLARRPTGNGNRLKSEEHTSELQ